ncbi:MAG: hypothetical protein FWE17_01485 [Alphaproteobacteria bacterium]|nr:hypothetical protein [Alphaproteobacteria bacterium]MCL2758071.1 hypothetical protein [Alphaproteobacteria bacterium]
MQNIREKLINRLIKYHKVLVDEHGFTNGAKIEADLGLDEFEFTDFIHWVDSAFDICLSDEETAKIKTFGDVIKIIEKKQKQTAKAQIMHRITGRGGK